MGTEEKVKPPRSGNGTKPRILPWNYLCDRAGEPPAVRLPYRPRPAVSQAARLLHGEKFLLKPAHSAVCTLNKNSFKGDTIMKKMEEITGKELIHN